MTRLARLLSLLLLLLPCFSAFGDATTRRLATLGRVWGTVKHAHPYLGSSEVRWDDAAVRAIARTTSANTDAELVAAVEEMLGAIGDPSTRVERTCVESGAASIVPMLANAQQADEMLYVRPGGTLDPALLSPAMHLAFDLRPLPGRCTSANAAHLASVATSLFSGTISSPPHRKVQHEGYKSQNPADAQLTFYSSSFVVEGGASFTGTGTAPRSTTFVVDEHSTLPPVAQAMIVAGHAALFSIGSYRDLAMSSQTVDLGGGFHARIRTSDPTTYVLPHVTLSADAPESAIIVAGFERPQASRRRAARGPSPAKIEYKFRYDDPYTSMKFPPLEYRVLAAFRYWNAIRYFYGYKYLIGDWEPRLEEIIDKLAATTSAAQYELALAEMTKFVPDGHSWAFTPAYLALRGPAAPPFQVVPAEGKAIVSAFTHESASAAGIRLGDELLSIDGRPIAERISELKHYISAAVETNLEWNAVHGAPRGPEGSEPTMRFRRPDGSEYEATVRRRAEWRFPQPPAIAWRVLPDNIGYVDMTYLETADVGRMLTALAATRAIIFDMRGYPRGSFFLIGQRLNLTGSSLVAQIRVPHVVGGELREIYRPQDIGKQGQPSFRGKTFMLIDERSQSAAEHAGLVLSAAAGAKFVGSHTSGSNGNVTYTVMPGGHYVMFTGMDVRHADGRQLQRIGLVPDHPVARTVAGIAAGRDEVLEKAIELALQP